MPLRGGRSGSSAGRGDREREGEAAEHSVYGCLAELRSKRYGPALLLPLPLAHEIEPNLPPPSPAALTGS